MKKSKRIFILLEIMAILGMAVCVYFFQLRSKEEDQSLVSEEDIARRFKPSISYQGKEASLKRNTTSLLLIGTDNYINDSKQIRDSFTYNYNLADFIVVLVFDHSAGTITPFQINRDSMCEVETLQGLKTMQLTRSHTMVTQKEAGKRVRETVERLLFGVPIDHYFSFTMDTVPLMNDLVGGVTVTLEDDIPELGPEFAAGASVTLHGNTALRFVRFRDTSLLDDNLRRMSHHRLYLTAFTEAARGALSRDQDLAVKAFKLIEKYVDTDMQADGISKLVENLCSYEILPVVTPPGTYEMGEKWAEYYLDEAALWDCVQSVFCVSST